MNKSELIAVMAEKSEMSKSAAGRVLDAFIATVTEELVAEGNISLVGFGAFKVNKRAARQGRNPQTGAQIEIAAANVPVFKAGANLKEAVN